MTSIRIWDMPTASAGHSLTPQEANPGGEDTLWKGTDGAVKMGDNDMIMSGVAQTKSGALRSAVTELVIATNVDVDLAVNNNFRLVLNSNPNLNNPTNQVAGQCGRIAIHQDGAGNHSLSFGSNWKFSDGTPPDIPLLAGSRSLLVYEVEEQGIILCSFLPAFS